MRTLALAMTHPHERLGLPQPIGRRLPTGVVGWNIVILAFTFIFAIFYIVQVNRAATRGFALHDVERHVEATQTQVMALEDSIAVLSSMQAMSERADQMGYVAIDRLEFASAADESYAMAE